MSNNLPSLLTQAKDLLKSLGGFARDLINADVHTFVSEEIQAQRFATCMECEHLTEQKRCTKCGCYMITKTKLRSVQCPIGKWGTYE